MKSLTSTRDRRGFLHLMVTVAGGSLLSGCGGGGEAAVAGSSLAVVPGTAPPSTATAPTSGGSASGSALNLALTLAYVGAQFYGHAASGAGVPSDATSGIGVQGGATGARQVSFADPVVARQASDLAADKLAHVLTIRAQLSNSAAAQPAIDLSPAATGPFATAAQEAGLVSVGAPFDPYANDTNFLIGAFLVENRVAAAYRALLGSAADEASRTLIAANLADAIFHGGVIRTLIADRTGSDPTADDAVTKISAALAVLDGSNVGDQTLDGANANLLDIEGRPIAFVREVSQVLKAMYLSSGSAGGFLPAGANGLSG